MGENYMIIKTKKLSPREVKKKLHEFIDNISEDCGPEIDQMADELKQHGDAFIDALSGYGGEGGGYGYNRTDMGGGGYNRGDMNGGGYNRNGNGYMSSRGWHKNEGTMEQREELRKKNEMKLQEMERQVQEMRQMLMQDM